MVLRPGLRERHTLKPCPRCGSSLEKMDFGGVSALGCRQCGGIWADREGLPILFAPSDQPSSEQTENSSLFQQAVVVVPEPADRPPQQTERRGVLSYLVCPNCKTPNPTKSLLCWACGLALHGNEATPCPRCDTPLAARTRLSVRLETCYGCGGIWLDWGELLMLVRRSPEQLRQLDAEIPRAMVGESVHSERMEMKCPYCVVVMAEQQYSYNSGVPINTCPQCKGAWLDAGELTRLAEFLAEDRARQMR